jgi:hypothetical protein
MGTGNASTPSLSWYLHLMLISFRITYNRTRAQIIAVVLVTAQADMITAGLYRDVIDDKPRRYEPINAIAATTTIPET